ncbi:hypothetical protein SCA6_000834 [Theobroma cacao]
MYRVQEPGSGLLAIFFLFDIRRWCQEILDSVVDVQLKFIVLLEQHCCVSDTDASVDSGCSCLVADADRTLGKEDVAVDGV